jgi:membrane protease YdiL (CAAX protease family)
LLACLASAGVLGVALFVAARLALPAAAPLSAEAAWKLARWLLLYLPVAFVLEEVFFRGALDSHVYRSGDSHRVVSAAFVAGLWGLWHLPVAVNRASLATAITGLLVIHLVIGLPLSVYWRRSGNLAVPGTAHALIDGVRNTLLT